MKKQNKFNIKIIGIVLIIIVLVGFIGYEQITGNQNADVGRTFEIKLPLDFSGQTDLNSNASILCSVKQTTIGIDSTGQTVATSQSSLLQGNPLLAITTASGVKMAGYVIEPKIFCENTFDDSDLTNPDRFTFVINDSNLSLQVQSLDNDGTKLTTHTEGFKTKQVEIPIGGSEQSLGFIGVYAEEIEDNLQDGSYGSVNEFNLRGNLQVYWKGFSGTVYTIPIEFGDVPSYHAFRIEKGDDGTTEFTGNDSDGDGINDDVDNCPNEVENYNGFEDGDGCPDVNPNTGSETNTDEEPVTKISCNDENKTWYIQSTGDGYCSNSINTSSGEKCNVFDVSSNSCVSPLDESAQRALTGKALWQVDIKDDSGGRFAFTPQEDQSPFDFSIPLDITGGKNIGESRRISEMTAQLLIKMDSSQQHSLTDVKTSDVKYQIYAGLGDKNAPQWILIKEQNAQDFIPRNGASAEAGISIGNINVKISEIETKLINAKGSTWSGADDLQLKVNAVGTVGIIFNDNGNLRNLDITLSSRCIESKVVDSIGTKECIDKNETEFRWTNLKFVRDDLTKADGSPSETTTFGDDSTTSKGLTCGTDQNKITNKDTGESFCIDIGTTFDDPNQDPKVGDEGVLICTDDINTGGFPCTEKYRIAYCGSADSTDCGSPQEDEPASTEDDNIIIDNDSDKSSDSDSISGNDLSCTSGGLNTLNLTNDACVISTTTDNTGTSSSGTNFCIGGNCDRIYGNSTMILIVGLIAMVSGIGVYAYKKRH